MSSVFFFFCDDKLQSTFGGKESNKLHFRLPTRLSMTPTKIEEPWHAPFFVWQSPFTHRRCMMRQDEVGNWISHTCRSVARLIMLIFLSILLLPSPSSSSSIAFPLQSLMRKAENVRISSPSWIIIMGVRQPKEIKEMQKEVEREGERGNFLLFNLDKRI